MKIRWKSNYPSVFYDRVFAKRETMAQLHRVANEWNIFPSPWKYTLLYGIQWDELMQMDCWPLSFGNPFRNLFNSLSKINPRAQNMSIRMEQKTTALRNRNTRRERKKEKIEQRGRGRRIWSMRWIVDPDRIATAIQKFEVGRSIDGPITYLILYASIIVAAVNCQQSWTFRLRSFDVFAHVRMPIKFDE